MCNVRGLFYNCSNEGEEIESKTYILTASHTVVHNDRSKSDFFFLAFVVAVSLFVVLLYLESYLVSVAILSSVV